MVTLKSIGLVKGVMDLEFYYKSVLHVFDIKIGNDSFTKEQKMYMSQIESQGGKGYIIKSFEKFQDIIKSIL